MIDRSANQTTLKQHTTGEEALSRPSLPSVSRDQTFPLSFAQQRLWFLEQLNPGKSVYNEYVASHLVGKVNIQALEQSFGALTRRHEILRTAFISFEGEVRQHILPWRPITLVHIDLQGLPTEERMTLARELAEKDLIQPYDFVNDPMLRVRLFRFGEADQMLLMMMHHTVGDGWSMDILSQELTALYRAYNAGRPAALPELPIQYANYTLWQHEWQQAEALQEDFAYWQRQLEGVPRQLNLPTDHPRPAVQSYTGAHASTVLPVELLQQLKSLSRSEHVTLFMTLLAAFQVLLMRYSGQQDIVVGSPIANRPRRELERVIGFFANTLILRTDLSGNPDFRQLLGRVREVTLQAYDHQEVPFEKLVARLEQERDLSRQPLVQVAFVLQNFSLSTFEIPEVVNTSIELAKTTSKFDLLMTLNEESGGLRTSVEYSTDLFEAASIERFLDHWQVLLEAIVQNVETPIEELPLLTRAEQVQLLTRWNRTQVSYPATPSLVELIEAQVARTPDAVALCFQDQQLTYHALDAHANRLAHHLQQQGVGPDTLVGVFLHRCLELPLALLAILKASGAYVPLDPGYPPQRLRFMLEDARISLLLTHRSLHSSCPPLPAGQLLALDEAWPSLLHEPIDPPIRHLLPEHLAYMIYTSGSTGQPKGAMNTHRALCNRLLWMQATYQLDASDRVLQKTPYSFDVSVWEFFWPLLSGACLHLALPGGQQDPAYLASLVHEQAISTLHFVPSMLSTFIEEPLLPYCSHLRQVLCSGEALSLSLQQRFFAHAPEQASLHNLYGPTEAAIDVSFWACEPESSRSFVPLGRPIANIGLYVLDAHLQPVPIGVPGELYIGGVGLARGYWQRPDLTAERFLPHPFSPQPGARLYRTGDQARYHADGTLEYLGRLDTQVKLRGQRLELGEIEALLMQHPTVRQAVVILQGQRPEELQLVAYVVLQPDADQAQRSTTRLREFLRQRLPEVMVPSWVLLLEALPLTPSGKLDRHQLPLPEMSTLTPASTELAGPHSALEELVAQSWQQVLSHPISDRQISFFDLGGHSLLATQVVARLRRLLQVEVPLRLLFEAPSLARFAARLEALVRQGQGLNLPALHALPRPETLPLSFAQQRLWFLQQLEPESLAYNLPAAMRLRGRLDRPALGQALARLIQRHENLRTTFPSERGRPIQVIAPEPTANLIVFDLTTLPLQEREQEAQRLVQLSAEQPFDLAHGPLLRASLLQIEQQDQILLLTLHHIISDGWSNEVLIRELTTLYTALSKGEHALLSPLPLQYADYALWQRQWLTGEVLQRQMDYWQQQLSDLAPLELPTDHPRPPTPSYRGAQQRVLLSASIYQQIRALSQNEGVTPFMTLLATLQVLLLRYSGQQDIAVGTPIANRTHEEIEGLIGCFVNTLVIRTHLTGNLSFAELLQRVREVMLQAYTHQDLPFEQLVEALQGERDLSRHPLFQVMCVFQQGTLALSSLPEMSIEEVELISNVSKFDLMLMFEEKEQGLLITLEYSTDLFEHETITRLAGHYCTLLEGISANPLQDIADLPLLTPAEREQVLTGWNANEQTLPGGSSVAQLLWQQAQQTPDAVAASFQGQVLTYRTLIQRAEQLADTLARQGVGPETLVALLSERDLQAPISILALMALGAAWLPLDPQQPAARLLQLLEGSNPALLLAVSGQQQLLRPLAEAASQALVELPPLVIVGDTEAQPMQHELQRPTLPRPLFDAHQLAYVIYTSGSTGRPKGAMLEHEGMLNHLYAKLKDLQISASDVMAQTAALSFDISVWQLLCPLLAGGRLHIVGDERVREPAALLTELEEEGITILEQVPSQLRWLLEAEEGQQRRRLAGLRWLIPTGEALSIELVKSWQQRYAEIPLLNAYGPTECSDDVTHERLDAQSSIFRRVAIGQPINNLRVYVLDERQQPVPIGIPGEIYVGGKGVGRGYQGEPEKTALAFVPDGVGCVLGGCL